MQANQAQIVAPGSGDVGSAVAHRLFRAGYPVIIHDDPQPTTSRWHMAFMDAIFEGQVMLAGVSALRIDDLLKEMMSGREALPVTVTDFHLLLDAVRPHILVDARMRKRTQPEVQRGLASLTIWSSPAPMRSRWLHVPRA